MNKVRDLSTLKVERNPVGVHDVGRHDGGTIGAVDVCTLNLRIHSPVSPEHEAVVMKRREGRGEEGGGGGEGWGREVGGVREREMESRKGGKWRIGWYGGGGKDGGGEEEGEENGWK